MTEYIWEPIKIAPNDQSLVGEVVKCKQWPYGLVVRYVQATDIILGDTGGSYVIKSYDWIIRREKSAVPAQSKKKVWAFGWYWNTGDYLQSGWYLSKEFFKSTNDFKFAYRSDNYIRHIWPAKMSPDGTFTEPE